MKYAVFNRLRFEEAEDNEPYVIEFNETIQFNVDDGIMMCSKYNIVFNEFITPPQNFYKAVQDEFLKMHKEGTLTDATVYTRDEWQSHLDELGIKE